MGGAGGACNPTRAVLTGVLPLIVLAACLPQERAADEPGPLPVDTGTVELDDGAQLRICSVGAGRDTVVVLHGGPGGEMVDAVFDPLATESRWTVVYYNQRGGAGYPYAEVEGADSATLTAHQHVEDLEALRRQLGIERLSLIGHSWGGGLAALYAMQFPDRVERLVLVAPIPPRRRPYLQESHDRRLDRERAAEHEPAWTVRPGNGRERSSVGPPACALSGDSRSTFHSNPLVWASLGAWDWRPALHRLEVPTLIVAGTEDSTPPAAFLEWDRALPYSRLLLLDGVGHFPMLDVPDRFYSLLNRFLRGR